MIVSIIILYNINYVLLGIAVFLAIGYASLILRLLIIRSVSKASINLLPHEQYVLELNNRVVEYEGGLRVVNILKAEKCLKWTDRNLYYLKNYFSITSPKGYIKEKNSIDDFQQRKPAIIGSFSAKRSSIKVLVVDDNHDFRAYLSNKLRTNYKVFESKNAESGIELALAISPDVIISDLVMPGLDGVEFCKIIKSKDETSHIPFILLTAYSTYQNQLDGYRNGADFYIEKPFSYELLNVRIKNLLAAREVLKRKFSSIISLQPMKISSTSTDDVFLQRVVDLIEVNISNLEFTVDDLSELLHMSSVHLFRRLKKLLQLSPGEFIRMIRITKAAELLQHTDMRIQEIMCETGFDNRSTFNSNFKKKFGVTPTEYGKKERSEEVED